MKNKSFVNVDVVLLQIEARNALRKMDRRDSNYKKNAHASEYQAIYAQIEKLEYCSLLYKLKESKEFYKLLKKQYKAVGFVTKYQQRIDENIEINKLKMKILA